MSRNLEYTFPAANEEDVCLLQDTDGGGDPLKLNGFLVNSTGAKVSFLERGYSRSLSLTSVNNLAAAQFFVNGIQNGVEIQEIISGPNNNTVFTTEVFDEITRVFVGPAVQDISIGTGVDGYFPLIGINLERPVIDYALSLATFNRTGIVTIIYATLDDIQENGESYNDNIINNKNLIILKPASTENNYILPPEDVRIYKSLLIEIIGTILDIDDEIQMKFIQS